MFISTLFVAIPVLFVLCLLTGLTERSPQQILSGVALGVGCISYALRFSLRAGVYVDNDTLSVVRPFGGRRSVPLRRAKSLAVVGNATYVVAKDGLRLLEFGGAPWSRKDLKRFSDQTGLHVDDQRLFASR